jgi:photosystem II stability/assembly factor-like uncharacterized protein
LIPSLIDDADLVSGMSGWVQADGKMFWTDDGGSAWRDITPPVPEDAYLWWVRFFDVQHGIALVVGENPPGEWPSEVRILVLRTDDGGRSWTGPAEWATLSLLRRGWARYAYALSQNRIWVSADITEMANSSTGEFFRADDGGRSWSEVSTFFSGQVVFLTADTGFTAGFENSSIPQLYRTRDGGKTWQQQNLAPIPDDERWYWHDYGIPVFFGPRDGVTAVALRGADWRWTDLVLYRTRDAGESWEQVAVFPGASESAMITADSTPLDAASATIWGVVHTDEAEVTRDGGESFTRWDLSPMSYVPKLLLSEGSLAWALELHNEGYHLYRSLDAGIHWEDVIGPW